MAAPVPWPGQIQSAVQAPTPRPGGYTQVPPPRSSFQQQVPSQLQHNGVAHPHRVAQPAPLLLSAQKVHAPAHMQPSLLSQQPVPQSQVHSHGQPRPALVAQGRLNSQQQPPAHAGCGCSCSAPILSSVATPVGVLQPGASGAIDSQQIPVWECTRPAPYELVCQGASNLDVSSLPPARRRIPVSADTALTVGRTQQPGFFEAFISSDLITFVSRAHFELAPVSAHRAAHEAGPASFRLTGMSGNPIVLGGKQRLSKGEQAIATVPTTIDFVTPPGHPTPDVVLVRLLLTAAATDVTMLLSSSTASITRGTAVPAPLSAAAVSQVSCLGGLLSASVTSIPSPSLSSATTLEPLVSMLAESRSRETSSVDDVQQADFAAYSEALARSLSRGHDVVRRIVVSFMESGLQLKEHCSVTSTFAPFEFPHGTDVERITIELRISRGGGAGPFQVSYKYGFAIGPPEAEAASKLPMGTQPAFPKQVLSTAATPSVHSAPAVQAAAPTVIGGLSAPEDVPFWLRLEGTAVRAEAEPSCWHPGSADGVIIGRSHQLRLHQDALKDGVLQYVSREHFRVDWGPGGGCLEAMGSNPVWLRKASDMSRTELWKGQPPLNLHHGDAILLFTGATDKTPDGPGCRGTLMWKFHQATASAAAASAAELAVASHSAATFAAPQASAVVDEPVPIHQAPRGGELFDHPAFSAAATRYGAEGASRYSVGGGGGAGAAGSIDETQPVPFVPPGIAGDGPYMPPQSYIITGGGGLAHAGSDAPTPRFAAEGQAPTVPGFGF